MRISVFWVFDQDTDLHAPLQGLGRLLNLDIETRDIVLYKKQTKKMKRTTNHHHHHYHIHFKACFPLPRVGLV